MLNVFASDAFSVVSLTRAIQAVPYQPQLLGQLGIFDPQPISTDTAAIEKLGNTLGLVQTSPRGSPPNRIAEDKRTVRNVATVRLATGERIYASQVNGVRAFGQESAVETMQSYAMRRMGRLRANIEATMENLRLGAVKGIVYDADGTTVIQNWFTFWGISAPADINFALGTSTTDVNGKCTAVIRAMQANGEGAFLPSTRVLGLCGNAFWDSLISHPNVEKWFLNRPAADTYLAGTAYQAFSFGGIDFVNYRGTDDGTTIAGIATDEVRFVPVGASDCFQMAYSPMAESEFFVNTMGLPLYALQVPDRDRGFWTDLEVYSYPLPIVTRPKMLQKGTRT